jgi:hypothetical protein
MKRSGMHPFAAGGLTGRVSGLRFGGQNTMATYLYETLPDDPAVAPERFEVKQSMKDAPLTRHPETGVPVKRVLVGGFAPMGLAKNQNSIAVAPARHPSGCSCCRH